jgi:S-adenosylmethionine/arginine decarboxylase-like enzyme
MHLLIRAEIMNPPGPNDCEKINQFMSKLVEHVRMSVMLEPVTAWCDDEGNEGITSTVILTTSHASMHIWNNNPPAPSIMQFDLYSCATFTVAEVFSFIRDHFEVVHADYKFLDREHGLTLLKDGHFN